MREELPVITVKNVLCCCLCYLQDWMAATLPTQTWTSPSWVWPASILHVAFTLGQESRVMLGTVWSQAHVPAALTSPKEILWACRTGTDQHPLSYLLDIETNKLWGWQSYSILGKGFCTFFFTNRYSWIYFPRCRPQRLQAVCISAAIFKEPNIRTISPKELMNYQLLCWNLSLFLWFPWTETGIYQPFPSHQLTAQLQPWLGQWWEVGSNCLKQENREPGLWGAQHPQVSGRNRVLKFTGVEACNMRNSVLQKVLQKYWAICSPFSSIMWKFKSYLFEAVSLTVCALLWF